MSEANRMLDPIPESYSPNKPEILSMVEKAQNYQFIDQVFVRKNTVELITLDEEIKIVGLDFDKCQQTGSVQLQSMFDLYAGDKIKLQENIRNVKRPQIGYAVYMGREQFVFGKAVTDFSGQDELYGFLTIPAGQYVKVSWNAESFSELVMEAMEKAWERAGADAFLEEHGLICDRRIYAEVYPHETMRIGCENGPEWSPNVENAYEAPITKYPEIYTLHSVIEKA